MCVCPMGFTGYLCQTRQNTKCYLNITKPELYKPCPEKKDSYFYMYSIPGFDPCHPIPFDEPIEIEFEVNCLFLMPGSTKFDSRYRKLGVNYPHLRDADEDALLDFDNRPDDYWRDQTMPYDVKNEKTGMRLDRQAADEMTNTATLAIYDMKWISMPLKFTTKVEESDALQVYAGKQMLKIKVDLQDIKRMDEEEDRSFINGGRLYFELSMSGGGSTSFVTRGFFDELGYVEPEFKNNYDEVALALWIAIPTVILLIIVLLCVCNKRKKEALKKDKKRLLKKKD